MRGEGGSAAEEQTEEGVREAGRRGRDDWRDDALGEVDVGGEGRGGE